MIELIIGILLAISTHTACDLGKPTDYYAWVDAHPDYSVAWTWTVASGLSTREDGDFWLMTDKGDGYYLFKFAKPIDDTIATGASHGECFRQVS